MWFFSMCCGSICSLVFLALVIFVVIVALRPAEFKIERSGTVHGSREAVFALINDFHEWTKWSPWEKMDPNLKRTYEGSAAGVGAKYAWSGNKKVGEGRMEILESRPGELVSLRLEFLKPFKATNTTNFTIVPEGNACKVIWSMTGTNNFMMKAFALVMNTDKMVGKDFEKGLANMDAAVSAPRP